MYQLAEGKQANEERRYLGFSLIAHTTLLVVLSIGGVIFPAKPLEFKSTVQVDLVALPDQTKVANQVIDPTVPVKEIAPEPDAAEPDEPEDAPEPLKKEVAKAKPAKDAAKEAKSALDKLKAEIEKERKAKNQTLADKKKQAAKEFEERYRTALKGNQTNQGSSTDGVMETVTNAYVAHIAERIRSNWSLPTWLRQGGYRAKVIIYIDSRGQIYKHLFTQRSGNENFDDYVLSTLKKSSPLAPPPAELAKDLQRGGMELLFPL